MQEKKSERESRSLDILLRFVMFARVNWIDSFLISYSLNKRIEEKSDILDKDSFFSVENPFVDWRLGNGSSKFSVFLVSEAENLRFLSLKNVGFSPFV